jgi:hypothetical protein
MSRYLRTFEMRCYVPVGKRRKEVSFRVSAADTDMPALSRSAKPILCTPRSRRELDCRFATLALLAG